MTKQNFPKQLLFLTWDMINNRIFYTWDGEQKSNITFSIKEGLQQDTVNSPILFNIYTYHIPNSFHLNSANNTYSLSFTDDQIIYVADKS